MGGGLTPKQDGKSNSLYNLFICLQHFYASSHGVLQLKISVDLTWVAQTNLIRSQRSEPGKFLDGRPPGNTRTALERWALQDTRWLPEPTRGLPEADCNVQACMCARAPTHKRNKNNFKGLQFETEAIKMALIISSLKTIYRIKQNI